MVSPFSPAGSCTQAWLMARARAALSPAPGDWIYYITVDPSSGETRFTASYDEFLRWKEEYQRNN